MALQSKLRKLHQLPAADRRLLISAALLVAGIRVGLLFLPFEYFRNLLSRFAHHDGGGRKMPQDEVSAKRVAWAVSTVSGHFPFTVNCFPQALAAYVLLMKKGVPSRIQIGVARRENGDFEAHAWVESRNQVVIGRLTDMGRFTPLPQLDGKLL